MTGRVFVSIGAVAITLASITACGSDGDTTVTPAPPISFSLSGSVTDTAGQPVPQASVEVVEGAQTGAATTTDDAGRFSFPQIFTAELTVRASKAGYLPQSNQIRNLIGYPSVISTPFQLKSATPSVDLAGNYVITFSADSVCTPLPPIARVRTYSAVITPNVPGTGFSAVLSGAIFAPPGRFTRFDRLLALVFGDFTRILFDDPEFLSTIVEEVSPNVWLQIEGSAEGTVTGPSFELPVSGRFTYCEERESTNTEFFVCARPAVTCTSSRHRLTLVRQ